MDSSTETATIEYVSPSFHVHTFVENICDTNIHFQIMKMDNSLFLWIGLQDNPEFQDLALSLKTPYDNLPLSTKLFGPSMEAVSSNLATKLVKKLKKPVYVSYNVPQDPLLQPSVEKRLNDEMKNCPHIFS